MESVLGSISPETSTFRDAALAELVEGYLDRLQAGETIDPERSRPSIPSTPSGCAACCRPWS